MGTTGQPGHRHGTRNYKKERRPPRSHKRHHHHRLPRTGDSDFTIELHHRIHSANSRRSNDGTCQADGHTRKQPTTLTLTTSITREICRTCADRALRKRPSSACHPHHLDSLHRSSDFKTTKQPMEGHLKHTWKNRLPKSTPRPELLSMPSSLPKQKPAPHLSKPRGEDAAIHRFPSRSCLQDDAPKEEKDAKTPPSPDPVDPTFPFEAKAMERRSTPPRRLFQERLRHPRASPSPAPMKIGTRIPPRVASTAYCHRPPPTNNHPS
uniref:Uncharacterized protein n=1 Tax=Aegilops tauschii subsp. strangulata TaxID=200361 RepID=A0A453B024_AEGTS